MSLPRLTSTRPMCSGGSTRALPRVGSPIRKSSDHWIFSSSPRLIAAVHVLHRHLTPRHPPRALSILTIFVEHTYVPLCSFQGTPPRRRAAGGGRARRISRDGPGHVGPDPSWGPSKLNSMSPAPVSRAAMNPYAERKTLPREGHRESQGVDVCSRASDSPAGSG